MDPDEQNALDPRVTFKHDQQAAQQEFVTRDEVQWDLNLQTIHADLEMKRAHAQHTLARASMWEALSTLIWLAVLLGVLLSLVALVAYGVPTVLGWFR